MKHYLFLLIFPLYTYTTETDNYTDIFHELTNDENQINELKVTLNIKKPDNSFRIFHDYVTDYNSSMSFNDSEKLKQKLINHWTKIIEYKSCSETCVEIISSALGYTFAFPTIVNSRALFYSCGISCILNESLPKLAFETTLALMPYFAYKGYKYIKNRSNHQPSKQRLRYIIQLLHNR